MKVWLLWEIEDYEPSTLHGIYSNEDKAERARDRLRNLWRRENIGYSVGPDEVWATKREAHAAADRRATEHLRIGAEIVK